MGDPMNVETVEDIRRALDNWEESGVPRNRALTWLAVLLDDRDRLLKAVQALRGVLVAAEEHRDDGWAAAAAAESREHQLRASLQEIAEIPCNGDEPHGCAASDNAYIALAIDEPRARVALTQEEKGGNDGASVD